MSGSFGSGLGHCRKVCTAPVMRHHDVVKAAATPAFESANGSVGQQKDRKLIVRLATDHKHQAGIVAAQGARRRIPRGICSALCVAAKPLKSVDVH